MRIMTKLNREQRRKDAKAKARLNRELSIHVQLALDAALIAANDVFHCGPERCEAFADAYTKNYNEILKDFEDGADYAFEDIDRRLEKICGKNFVPWGERYGR